MGTIERIPAGLTNVTALAAGGDFALALKPDGTVLAWPASPGTPVPADVTNAVAVSAGTGFSVALRNNGTVSAWGWGWNDETNVPPGLTDVVALDCGTAHTIALRRDGTVVTWGFNPDGRNDLPPGLGGVVAVSAGTHNLALRADGTVVGWGFNHYGQADVPADLSNIVAVAAGGDFSVALKADGTVRAWGASYAGQDAPPAGLSNVVALAAGWDHALALLCDGRVAAWGNDYRGAVSIPIGLDRVIGLAPGGEFEAEFSLVRRGHGAPVITVQPVHRTANAGEAVRLTAFAVGQPPLRYQWFFNAGPLAGATQPNLLLPPVQLAQAGRYVVSISNAFGTAFSREVTLSVVERTNPPVILTPPTSLTCFAGQTATFTVEASGTPPLAYQWQKDATELAGQTSATLTLADVQLTAAGGYRVIVSNAAGSITSAVATLTILPPIASPGSLDLGFDPTRGGELLALESHRGSVQALALQPDGKVIVGGEFIGVNGAPRYNLARLNADGSLDPGFNPSCSTDGRVRVVVVQPDGKVLLAGEFAFANTLRRQYLARVHADGTLDMGLDAGLGPCLEGSVYRLVLQPDGKVVIASRELAGVVGEVFTLRRLNSDGSADANFPARTWTNAYIGSLALQPDGKLLVGINTQFPNQPLLRLTADGTADPAFQPQLAPPEAGWPVSVSHVALQSDGRIIVQGGFAAPLPGGGQRRWYARLNSDGSVDPSFNAGANPPTTVETLCLQPDGKLLVGLWTAGPIRLNTDGSRDQHFDAKSPIPGEQPSVNALALRPDGRILVGRAYNSHHLERLDCVYQLHSNGRRDTNFIMAAHPAGAVISAVARQADGRVLIGGRFNHLNGQPLNGIARLNPDGSWDQCFRVALLPLDWVGAVVTLPDGKALIGVATTEAGSGNTIRYCVRLHADGTVDGSFAVPLRFFQPACVQPDGRILGLGSWPWEDGGWASTSVVRLEPDGRPDPSFNAGGEGPSGGESSVGTVVLLPDGKILIGGEFESYNGVPRQGLARLNADGTLDPSFDLRGWTSTWVSAVAVQGDGRIVVGGDGFWANATWLGQVIRLHPDGRLDPSFNAAWANELSPNAIVLQPDGKLIVAGSFRRAAGEVIDRNIARLNPDGSWDASFDVGAGANAEVNDVLLQPDGQVLIGGRFSAVNGVPRTGIARLHNDSSMPVSFVQREIAAGGVIRLVAAPAPSVSVYAVEDQPPVSWPVTNISHGGAFDGATGKVKFGPFYDLEPRTLSYAVVTPEWGAHCALGVFCFRGQASADGVNSPVGGDQCMALAGLFPADVNPADNRINIGEITAYGAAWRRGSNWLCHPQGIPIDYVTRAAFLWRAGECYVVDPAIVREPMWWVACGTSGGADVQSAGTQVFNLRIAARQMPAVFVPGEPFAVTVATQPGTDTRAHAVEEVIPAGWSVSAISGGGDYDAAGGKVKWGPFFDAAPRTLNYRVRPPVTALGTASFSGAMSCDGTGVRTTGAGQVREACRVTLISPAPSGPLQLTLSGRLGARFVVEASSDLASWTALATVTNTDGRLVVTDPDFGSRSARFYRARLLD